MSRKISKKDQTVSLEPIILPRKFFWTSHSFGKFVKGFASLILLCFLIVPLANIGKPQDGSGITAVNTSWVLWLLVGLVSALALFSLYGYLATFYVFEDDNLVVFCRFKYYHFRYNEIKKVEAVTNPKKNVFGSGYLGYYLEVGTNALIITPLHFEEFGVILNKKRGSNK
jgi:hypothetical protein